MKSLKSAVILAGSVVMTLLACEVQVAGNAYTPEPASYISGSVRLDDGSVEPGGPAILFRFDCDAPPPPQGAGSPADFVVVPESSFDAGAAEFVFPLVPPTSCHIIAGFVDRDRDFHYAYSVTAQASAGDLSISPRVVEIGAAVAGTEWIEPVVGVLLRAETPVPLERPAFEPIAADSGEVVAPSLLIDPAGQPLGDALFLVSAHEVRSDLVDVVAPVFTVVFAADGDEDGLPDDLNDDTLPDILWPKVVIRRLEPSDPNGQEIADPLVHLAALVLPLNPLQPEDGETNLLAQALSSGQAFDGVSALLAHRIAVLVPGLAVVSPEPLELVPLSELASSGVAVTGRYQLLLMNSTGQTWSLPNELSQSGDLNQGLAMTVETAESRARR